MTKQYLHRRGTTQKNDLYVGGDGEITIDSERGELRIHDGITPGGSLVSSSGSMDGGFLADYVDIPMMGQSKTVGGYALGTTTLG